MQVSISARHGSLTKESQEYIERKLPKLSHIFERLISINVTVDFQTSEPEVEFLVEAEHKHDFVARERAESVTAAFDKGLEKWKVSSEDTRKRSKTITAVLSPDF